MKIIADADGGEMTQKDDPRLYARAAKRRESVLCRRSNHFNSSHFFFLCHQKDSKTMLLQSQSMDFRCPIVQEKENVCDCGGKRRVLLWSTQSGESGWAEAETESRSLHGDTDDDLYHTLF
jgi:hypothetical protein